MALTSLTALPILALMTLAPPPPAAMTTFVVDSSGGPGSQFTQIQPAIDAAGPGDLIIVRAGNYRSFVLDKGLAITGVSTFGFTAVNIDPGCVIRDVAAGQRVALDNLFVGTLQIRNCDGVVAGSILNVIPPSTPLGPGDDVAMEVVDCADVRLRQFGVNPGAGSGRDGLRVVDSRVELDGSTVDGARAPTSTVAGGTGIVCGSGSTVHVAFSWVRGGAASFNGGAAGPAITVAAGATLRVRGTIDDRVLGGFGQLCGTPAPAIVAAAGADVRVSASVQVSGGTVGCGGPAPAFGGAGTAVIANPDDPVMFVSGENPQIGAFPALDVRGQPGAQAVLLIGTASAVLPIPGIAGNELRQVPLVALPLGAFPAGGKIAPALSLPPRGSARGVLLLFQTATLRTSGALLLTNGTMFVGGS